MKVPASLLLFPFTAIVLVGLVGATVPGSGAEEPAVTNLVKAAETATTEAITNRPVEFLIPPQFLEQIRREIEENSARNAAAITTSLSLLEPALSRLQQRQDDALIAANNKVLIMASVFAGVIFLVLVAIILILARTLGRFSDLAVAGSPRRRELQSGSPAALEAGGPSGPDQAVEQASNRFQGALEQLQRRILELEHGLQGTNGETSRQELGAGSSPRPRHANGASGISHGANEPPASPHSLPQPGDVSGPLANESSEVASRAAVLLGKGQTLLNLGDGKQALACFEQVLAMTPNNTEAQVKKGLAFEQLENWDGALESYNRALAIDETLTVAYLYKGAVCNRLQRYDEALASYELALHRDRNGRAP